MDSVAGFKAQALAGMQRTVEGLGPDIERARPYLKRARAEAQRERARLPDGQDEPEADSPVPAAPALTA